MPKGVDINFTKGNVVTVKGPKGSLSEQIDPDITIKMEDGANDLRASYRSEPA